MPLAGTDGQLASSLNGDIIAKYQQLTGKTIQNDKYLQALCQAVAETVIAHIVANAKLFVEAGIPVQVQGPDGTDNGQTVAPGTGKIL